MNCKQFIYHLKWLLIVLLVAASYAALFDQIDAILVRYKIATILKYAKIAIEGSVLVQGLVILTAIFISILYAVKRWNEKKINLPNLSLYTSICMISVLICAYDTNCVFVEFFGVLSSKYLIGALSCILLLVELVFYIRDFIAASGNIGNSKYEERCAPFTTDNTDSLVCSEHMKGYVKQIVKRIATIDNNKEAFAIGIAGSWGSGKTTLLNQLRSAMPENIVVMDFFPWNSKSPEMINEDFFKVFRDVLSMHVDPFLAKPVESYASHLNTINRMEPWWAFTRNMLLATADNDTNSLKQRIVSALADSKKKIVINIDDIDRLDKDELFEVLRLIRNSANMPNIIFIVTYDKKYVVSMLTSKKVHNPTLFLEKIFNVELMLPKVLIYDLLRVLLDELTTMTSIEVGNEVSEAINKAKNGKFVVTHLLTNYREIKRFARQFSLHYSCAQDSLKNNFNVADLFWLEVLRYADYNTYSILRDDPNGLLSWKKGVIPKVATLRDFVLEESKDDFNDARSLNKYVAKVLKEVFTDNKPSTSVVYSNNYTRYFSLGVENAKIYIHELEELIEGDAALIEPKLIEWFGPEQKDKRDINSLLFLIDNIDTKEFDAKKAKNLLTIVFTLYRISPNTSLNRTLLGRLNDEHLDTSVRKEIRGWTIKQMENLIGAIDYVLYVAICNNCMIHNIILNEEDCVKLLGLNFKSFAENKQPDAFDITTDSTLQKLYKQTTKSYEMIDDDGETYEGYCENIIWEYISQYFKTHRSAKYKEFDNFFSSTLTDEELFSGISEQEKRDVSMSRVENIFGDWRLLDVYRKECFADKAPDSIPAEEKDRQRKKDNNSIRSKFKKPSKTKMLRNGTYIKSNR